MGCGGRQGRGTCRLRYHHPCRDIGQPLRYSEARRVAPVTRSRKTVDNGDALEREFTCDAAHRDRWLRIYVLTSGRALTPQAADNVDA